MLRLGPESGLKPFLPSDMVLDALERHFSRYGHVVGYDPYRVGHQADRQAVELGAVGVWREVFDLQRGEELWADGIE